jgi:hypothetical protein
VIPAEGVRHRGRAISVGVVLLVTAGCASTPSSDARPAAASSTTLGATSTTESPTTTTPPPATSTPTTASAAPSGIQVGPGPRTTYTIEPQPAAGSCHYRYRGPYPLPDPRCTPGAIDPQVTAANISSTICSAGYTANIRPPERVTEPEKIASAAAYGYAGPLHTAEYDHVIPLELGGDPNDPTNLWVEPNDNPSATTTTNSKDSLENVLNGLVCSGRLSLTAARQAIATDWVAALQQYG